MVDGSAREQAIYQALKAAAEVAAALQARLIEEHNADPERAATQSTFTTSLKLLRQARERFGQGLRAAGGPATSPSLTRSVCATESASSSGDMPISGPPLCAAVRSSRGAICPGAGVVPAGASAGDPDVFPPGAPSGPA